MKGKGHNVYICFIDIATLLVYNLIISIISKKADKYRKIQHFQIYDKTGI